MSNSYQTPYLSIVATSRNDSHGGDMFKRMSLFVKSLIYQCNLHQFPCELIMVEWNPIDGEKLLKDVLPTVKKEDFLSIRYIIVPHEIHSTLTFSEQIPLFQMIAKNVGIRRAMADFVLCTNVDLIFSTELFERLAKRDLKQDYFYRANRCDIPATINENWTSLEQLDFSKKNILKRNGKNHYDSLSIKYLNRNFFIDILIKTRFFIKSYLAKPKTEVGRFGSLDFEACGDFTLMSKKNWLDIEGYPELEVYSLHIDSMGLIAAEALEIKQVIFKPEECTYHIKHSNGWEFESPFDRLLFYTKKPSLDYWAVYIAGLELIKKKRKFGFNKKNWGFADINFKELH